MLPKKDGDRIKFQINQGVLSVVEYEFICLRLIDTIRQLEEINGQFEKALKDAKKKLEELAGDSDYPKRQTLEGNLEIYDILTKALKNQ